MISLYRFIEFLYSLICVYLMRVWKKHFYLKKKLFYKKNIKTITKLKFGNIAFTTSQVLILNSIFLLRFILFLKKIARKSEKTLRYF